MNCPQHRSIGFTAREKSAGYARSIAFATGRHFSRQAGFFDVSNIVQLGHSRAPHVGAAMTAAPDARPSAGLSTKAGRMHMLGRLRGKHFFTPVMADSAMDVMLSLFVGELQSVPVSDTALAVGNLLSRDETDTVIDKLVHAGLAAITGSEPDRRTVGLTPLGSARMRSFVSDYPDV